MGRNEPGNVAVSCEMTWLRLCLPNRLVAESVKVPMKMTIGMKDYYTYMHDQRPLRLKESAHGGSQASYKEGHGYSGIPMLRCMNSFPDCFSGLGTTL